MTELVVGYRKNNDDVHAGCFDGYIERQIDERIERLTRLAQENNWLPPYPERDRGGIHADLFAQEVKAIFASSRHDSYPECVVCSEYITNVALTPEGRAYERRAEHAHLEEDEDNTVISQEQQAYLDAQPERLAARGLKFGVIYSLDLAYTEANWLSCYQPWPHHWPGRGQQGQPSPTKAIWTKTEGDAEYEYDHLEGDWVGGIHRKYVATLDKDQFRAFMEVTSLVFESENTGGSLGGPTPDEPNGGIGWQPAIAFNDGGNENGVIISAYVTPFWVGEHTPDDRDWDRIVAMLREKCS